MLNEIQKDAQLRMDKTLTTLNSTFSKIRAGRAHPSLLEQIQVDYYGTLTPISQMANINAEDARTLKVSAWEKEMVEPIEKAIISSDLGLNPTTVGQVIRIPLPALTEDRRQDLVKIVKEAAENAKIAIRNIRRDANTDFKELLKQKEISKDEAHRAEDAIQTITDQCVADVEKKLTEKQNSLLEI